MANARAKKKAKSVSKKKPVVAKKKVAAKKAAPAKKVKKPVAKKVKKPAPAKKISKAAPKKKVTKPAAKKVSKPKSTVHPTVMAALEKADIEGFISRLPPPAQPLVKSLRSLVLENAPEASESLDDGSPAYFANGIFARIVPEERAVLVKFLKANDLPSSSELEGDTFEITELNEVKENVLRKLVREAVALNLKTTP